MTVILVPLLQLLDIVLELYQIVLIVWVVFSWLAAFNVVNTSNGFVRTAMNVLWRLTEPALRPIRRIVPLVSGFDFSPLILLLAIYFLRGVVGRMIYSVA
ncbi:MAG: YggT family protein [Alphaproteobacteria bacterium]|nr:YggT family protein [Alphaproteobacteria bacterium]MCY4229591.1 YggT family protein [Alphaproteobacteria bacterium]MCY4320584.1 YggT family protein [Alphaproteobacteria bacterium]